MPRFRSAPTSGPDGQPSKEALFTKELLADSSVSYLKELTHPENPQVECVLSLPLYMLAFDRTLLLSL